MLCGNCGHELVSGAPFCGNCGAAIATAPAQPVAAQVPSQPGAQPNPVNPAAPPPPAGQPTAPPPPPVGAPAQPGQPAPAPQPQYQQQYQQPYQQQYPVQPGAYPNAIPLNERYNEMAIIALVLVFVFWPAAIIFAILALKQIKKTNEKGKSLAVASLVISGIFTLLFVVYLLFVIAFVSSDYGGSDTYDSDTPRTSQPALSES